MTESDHFEAKRGFVGYFDLLGYKNILTNNDINKAIDVVKLIQKIIEQEQERVYRMGKISKQKFCDYLVYSDSILVYNEFPENQSGAARSSCHIS
ncbi:MAG: hypothetical protein WDM80_15500 [Limisphaerales bacterium]